MLWNKAMVALGGLILSFQVLASGFWPCFDKWKGNQNSRATTLDFRKATKPAVRAW